mmetsp:Transcript_19605/g.30129  ORF Transcript_19605/g.30129 Transcript_19605/m.30129 type:complete len:86 (+) Transcript_19605:102-359(+)
MNINMREKKGTLTSGHGGQTTAGAVRREASPSFQLHFSYSHDDFSVDVFQCPTGLCICERKNFGGEVFRDGNASGSKNSQQPKRK